MSKTGYAVIFVVGAIAGAVGLGALREHNLGHVPKEETIALADRSFYDTGSTEAVLQSVVFQGAYVGDAEADLIKNNTVSAFCSQTEMRCSMGEAAQIGEDQMGAITLAEWPVTQWSPDLIVAQDDEMCAMTTMNIDRNAKTVSFVAVPKNLTSPICDRAPTQVRRWTLGRSRFWSRMEARLPPKK